MCLYLEQFPCSIFQKVRFDWTYRNYEYDFRENQLIQQTLTCRRGMRLSGMKSGRRVILIVLLQHR